MLAAAPERGRSALDGGEAMNSMVNLMREHVTMESRIHYAIIMLYMLCYTVRW